MNITQFRKLSYALYVTDENDLVKMAGPISGLKRLLRRMLNRTFSEEAKDFKESNSDLKDSLQNLYSVFKSLEDAIDDHDLAAYKQNLDLAKIRTSKFIDLLSKNQSDVNKIEDEAKNEIKTKLKAPATNEVSEGPAQEESPKSAPEASTKDDSEQVSEQLTPEVENLISNLAPQSQVEEHGAGSVQPVGNTEPAPVTEPVAAPMTAAQFAASKPPQFPASELMAIATLHAKDLEGAKKRIVGPVVSGGEITSTFGTDLSNALAQGKVKLWKKAASKSSKSIYLGDIEFSMNTPYMKKEFLGTARVSFDTGTHVLELISVKQRSVAVAEFFERREIRKFARNLGPNFWPKFNAMATRLGMAPDILLPVMFIESAGFNPQAVNKHGGAVGLVQFMPQTLEGMGWKAGGEAFRNQSGEEQLDLIEKFIKGMMGFNGGVPYKEAASYYVSNFWPDALRYRKYYEQNKGKPGWWPEGSFHDIQAGDPEAVVVEARPQYRKSPNFSMEMEAKAYAANPALDKNKDGKITYGDLQALIQQVKGSGSYKALEAEMRSAGGGSSMVERPGGINQAPAEQDNNVIRYMLDNMNMPEIPATSHFLDSLMQGLEVRNSAQTDMIEVFGKHKNVNGEFVRVASLVLARDYGVLPDIFSSGAHFQITYPTNRFSTEEITSLCADISEELKAVVSAENTFRFYVRKGASATIPELTLERAQKFARAFRLTFMELK